MLRATVPSPRMDWIEAPGWSMHGNRSTSNGGVQSLLVTHQEVLDARVAL
jgi:hypothetical protein